jgi:hypothetical protein
MIDLLVMIALADLLEMILLFDSVRSIGDDRSRSAPLTGIGDDIIHRSRSAPLTGIGDDIIHRSMGDNYTWIYR